MTTSLPQLLLIVLSVVFIQAAKAAPILFYGGFATNQTFSFTLKEIRTEANQGGVVTHDVGIPNGIPIYTFGQPVTFKIGKKGSLTGPGFSFKFVGDVGFFNVYLGGKITRGNPAMHEASVFKTTTNLPTGVAITFRKLIKVRRQAPVVVSVTYIFE